MGTSHRYELTDAQWNIIKPHLQRRVGRKGDDDRRFINAVLWIARSGAPWRDLPEHYGQWSTAFQRYHRWSKRGLWQRLWEQIRTEQGLDLARAAIDSTVIRAHQHAAGQKKTQADGSPSPESCIGRSAGGLTTKIPAVTDALGNSACLHLSAG
jgi:transposase